MRIARILLPDQSKRYVTQQPDGTFRETHRLLTDYATRQGMRVHDYYQPPYLLTEAIQEAESALGADTDLSQYDHPADVTLLCPMDGPNRILAIGRNYGDHARELGNAVPEEPIVFMKAPSCVIGPNEPIEIPEWLGRVDFEGELLVVIGKGGKNIDEADAMSYVSAYSLFNDVTARDKQRAAQEKKHPWFLAKSFDTSGPLGPFLVTADAVPDPHSLRIVTTVNGEVKQDGSTSSMIYSIPFLIAYLSKWLTLHPGDVIATGTPAGVGPIKPGDRVEVTIDGFGTLSNPVTAV